MYTVNQVAELLKLNPATIREWLKAGQLKGTKAGKQWRIFKEDIKSLIPKEVHMEQRETAGTYMDYLDETERKSYEEFEAAHKYICSNSAEDHSFHVSVIFSPTGIGTHVECECSVCRRRTDITKR